MKSKYYAWIISVVLGITVLTGCGASSTTESTEVKKEAGGFPVLDESATLGQISKIDGNTISIEIGTQKKFEKGDQNTKPDSDQQSDNGKQEDKNQQNGERPSMLELTGEEQEIYVTDNTTITRQSMGKQRGNREDTNQSEDAAPPEDADNNGQNNPPEGQQPESEEISLEDISVGDIISVTLDENNNAESITVISGGDRGVENESI